MNRGEVEMPFWTMRLCGLPIVQCFFFVSYLCVAFGLLVAGLLTYASAGLTQTDRHKKIRRAVVTLLMTGSLMFIGLAQRVYDTNPPLDAHGTVVSVHRASDRWGIPLDRGEFMVLLDAGPTVSLSTRHWTDGLQMGRTGLFSYDGHDLLLKDAYFDCKDSCTEPVLSNHDDFRRMTNAWMWLAAALWLTPIGYWKRRI